MGTHDLPEFYPVELPLRRQDIDPDEVRHYKTVCDAIEAITAQPDIGAADAFEMIIRGLVNEMLPTEDWN